MKITEELPIENILLVTRSGEILLIGGIYESSGEVSNEVKQLVISQDRGSCSVKTLCHLFTPRFSASAVCLKNQKILVVGGRSAENTAITSVEEISLVDLHVTVKKSCLFESARSSLCLLGEDDFLVKIGGIADDKSIHQAIERYDIRKGVWQNVDPSINSTIKSTFHIFFGIGCVALNDH